MDSWTSKGSKLKVYIFQADGLTSIEAWLIACIVFVFAALIEYTGILLKMKLRKLNGTKRKKDNYAVTDLSFFVLFPVLFSLFNLLYWTTIWWTRTKEQQKYNLWYKPSCLAILVSAFVILCIYLFKYRGGQKLNIEKSDRKKEIEFDRTIRWTVRNSNTSY